jgi:hypothetical protein
MAGHGIKISNNQKFELLIKKDKGIPQEKSLMVIPIFWLALTI